MNEDEIIQKLVKHDERLDRIDKPMQDIGSSMVTKDEFLNHMDRWLKFWSA